MLQLQPKPDRVENQPFALEDHATPAGCTHIVSANLVYTVTPGHTCPPSKTPQAPHTPSHPFKYAGRHWRLFKRDVAPDSPWQIEWQRSIDGRTDRQRHSLHSSSLTHALAAAKALIDRWLAGHRRPKKSEACASLREVLAIVDQLPITASLASRASYVWSLRWVLRLALGITDAQVDELRADVLSKDTARRFWNAAMTHANGIGDQSERSKYLRNCVTFYDNAKALFAPLPLDAMKETFHLKLPSLEDFRNGRKLFLREKVETVAEFTPPPQAIERRTLVEWVRLGRTPGYTFPGEHKHGGALSEIDRRNMFIAVGLALAFGFRKGDFIRARWNWFVRDESGPLCRVQGERQKNRRSVIEVSAVDPFWTILNRIVDRNGWRSGPDWQSSPDAYCLAERASEPIAQRGSRFKRGGVSDRTYWPAYLVGHWLRWLGWTTQKTNHALRDLVASKLTMKYGLDAACDWCRHAQQATTESHYNRFKRRSEQINPKRLAWLRWAK